MINKYDYIIVGGGIIGLSIAYKLAQRENNKSILVIEKEQKLATHQTGRNSGVIHSGIYYKPGSFKAKNCKDGRIQLIDFAKKHNVSFEMCGKIIAAFDNTELETLSRIYDNGIKNGLEEIKYLSSEETKKYEPYIDCVKSIFVPYAGIINYSQVVEKLSNEFQKINSKNKILKSSKVVTVRVILTLVFFVFDPTIKRLVKADWNSILSKNSEGISFIKRLGNPIVLSGPILRLWVEYNKNTLCFARVKAT